MYIGELAALATAVLWAITSLFFTVASRLIGAGSVNRLRLGMAMVLIALFHWWTTGSLFPFETEPWRWGVLSLSSLLGLVIGDGALFLAFIYIGPRLTLLVMIVVPVMTALFGWICFGESLDGQEQLGILVTLLAIGWVVFEKRGSAGVSELYPPDKYVIGIVLALVGAVGQTANLIVTKYALIDGYSTLSATEVRIFVALVILWMLAGCQGQLVRSFKQMRNPVAALFVLAGAIAGPFLGIWFSYVSIQNTRVGIAATIMATPPLLLIPLSALFFKEKTSWRGWVGTIVAFLGIVLLLWDSA
ncbi:MAG: DMT family transporter [Mariniblastus sp.]|nr:DMT family transporter [Mariniblastus sp.]